MVKAVQQELFPFELPKMVKGIPTFGAIRTQVWTEQKAKLISRYLKLFVFITHHGTYIDGFAGPQYSDKEDSWTAKMVLENEPRWLRRFFLCDLGKSQVEALERLVGEQPQIKNRHATVMAGDFNSRVGEILNSGHVAEGIASFCLLDQRTFECEWRTVETIASAKQEDHQKMERQQLAA